MKSKATAAGVAALINKAQRLHRQSAALIKQAQDECKHPNLNSNPYHKELATYYDPSHTPYNTHHWCPDCGKRWVE